MPIAETDRNLQRHSYYEATTARREPAPALQASVRADVAIVGGGLAGVSAALELAERGFRVHLLEAREIGSGASGRNGGQAIHGYACDQTVLEAQLGAHDARRLWDLSIEALDLIRDRIERHRIDCDWQDGYLAVALDAHKGAALGAWADRMAERYGYPLQRIGPARIRAHVDSPRFHSGAFDPRSGHLHPLRYVLGLAQAARDAGAQLHERSPVTRLEHGPQAVTLHTPQGRVVAQQVLLAGNVYLNEFGPAVAPRLAARMMPVGTYIACTARMSPVRADSLIPSRAAVCDTQFVLDYFRLTRDDRLLYGGLVSYSTATPHHLAERLRARIQRTFPQLADVPVDYTWGGFVDISMNRAPDFGRLPAPAGQVARTYYLQGFSGHGLALSGLAGRLVAEAMAGDASRFDVFARLRHRPFPGGRRLRTPALVLGMAWYRLRDLIA